MPACPQLLLLCALVVVAPAFAANQIYRYTDDSGTLTFTNELKFIPEKYRGRAVPLESDHAPTAGVVKPNRPAPALRVVTASGEYRMSDHDTRSDAVRLAIEDAKRQALEQVATYLESVTEVKNLDVTRDEIQTYTAGVVTVLSQKINTRIEDGTVVIHADLTAQADQNEVVQAIMALRENESAKQELVALRTETDRLRDQLDAANQALAATESPEQVQALTLERQQLLDQLQANSLVSQAWIYAMPVPTIGVGHLNALLLRASRLHPTNQHLQAVQQVVTSQGGVVPATPRGSPPPPPPVGERFVAPSPGGVPMESARSLQRPQSTIINPPVSPLMNPPVSPLMNPPVSPLLPMIPSTIQPSGPPVPHQPSSPPQARPRGPHRGREAGRQGGDGHSGGPPGR